ncbi:hypothetical protein JTB14_029659 [Gonioctena quinquepunctata]|nr:hypothetical protein JTB14_029659 [Gonioctena quinquepunctata]
MIATKGRKQEAASAERGKIITVSSKDSPVLLSLDGHTTHTKNIDSIDEARKSGVVLLSFPPHCTQRLQHLDVGFMKPLSTYYVDKFKKWLRVNPGRVVTHYQAANIFGKAFSRAATMPTAINALKQQVFGLAILLFLQMLTLYLQLQQIFMKQTYNLLETWNVLIEIHVIRKTKDVLKHSAKDHADKKKLRKGGEIAIWTKSPYRNELLKAIKAAETEKLNAEATKRKIIPSGNENEPKGKLKQNKSTKSDEEDSDDGSDVECLYWRVFIFPIH